MPPEFELGGGMKAERDTGTTGEGPALQRALMESMPLPVFIKDLTGRFVDCNSHFAALLGLPRESIIGATNFQIAPRAADGSLREIETHESLYTDSRGQPQGMVCVIRDVTEERRSKQRLEESEARYARLAELTHEGVVLHRDGLIVDVNDALTRITGWPREELLGRDYAVLIAPDCLDEAREKVRARYDQPYRLMMRRADGTLFPAEAHGRDILHHGQPIRVVAVTDITERVEAEHAVAERALLYRQMFETNTAVKLLIDPLTGEVVDANRAAEIFYGWPLDTLRKMRITDINALPPELVRAEMAHARAEDRMYFRFPHRTASGEIRTVEVYSGPVTYRGRSLLHSIIHDVTDRERAREELERKTQALEVSNADLQQFAYVASHDLQEPLRMVVSYLQLLQRRYQGKLDEQADEFIGYAVDGAKRMSHLIQDLLSYSRVETQGRPLQPVSAAAAVDSALANLTLAVASADAEIDVGQLPMVLGDEAQLTSLFQNLIGNALKYRDPQRRVRIQVAAEQRDGEWLFSVTDNGIGIAPEFHDRIFMIFQRLHSHSRFDGTGIGLALARRIVGRHGGRLWVESEEGAGACFRFTLKPVPAVTPPAG